MADVSIAHLESLRASLVAAATSCQSAIQHVEALIADADKARGDVFGRVLGNAGYEVKYALDAVSLKFYAQQKDLKLIVANAELGDAKALIEQARGGGHAQKVMIS